MPDLLHSVIGISAVSLVLGLPYWGPRLWCRANGKDPGPKPRMRWTTSEGEVAIMRYTTILGVVGMVLGLSAAGLLWVVGLVT